LLPQVFFASLVHRVRDTGVANQTLAASNWSGSRQNDLTDFFNEILEIATELSCRYLRRISVR
jgi:hypothetical protein